MSAETIIALWKDARGGLIQEVERIPEEKFSFRATPDTTMMGLTGQPITKAAFLTFAFSHEMYHRGQLTVFERLLNIEPALTERFKKMVASAG